ncbi:MAG: UspA protein, partial [Chloroflexi bacterium]|nr:UspA protein [Chloroflexota bacterium]
LRPGCNLLMTLCDQYDLLLSQIEVHRYFLWLDQQVELPRDAVITDWYDHAYLPIVELIQAQGLLLDFPEQTETDLYMLITEHRLELQRQLGWQVDTPGALQNLAREKSPRRGKRLGERFLQTLIPDAIKSGPQAGAWRQERLARRENTNLFADILVAGRGLPADWNTLDHAIRVAQREKARLLGLRVVPDPESDAWDTLESIKKEFAHRCSQAGVRAEATFEKGPVVPTIVQRSAWADLLVLSLVRQSGPETKIGVGSDFDLILQRSPRPVLVVPEGAESPLDRVVLAFDGSPKANEALYAAAYMVDQWRIDLVVINGGTSNQPGEALGAARDYLERRELPASFVYLQGSPAQVILDSAVIYESNLIIMGGYGIQPLAHLVVGSTVHAVLRSANIPVLICR